MVGAGVGDGGDFQPAREKADAPVDLAQTLFAVEVVAVFAAVAIFGGPVHGFHHLRAFVVHQLHQLGAQGGVACGRDVVAPARRQGRQRLGAVFAVIAIGFFGEGFAHV